MKKGKYVYKYSTESLGSLRAADVEEKTRRVFPILFAGQLLAMDGAKTSDTELPVAPISNLDQVLEDIKRHKPQIREGDLGEVLGFAQRIADEYLRAPDHIASLARSDELKSGELAFRVAKHRFENMNRPATHSPQDGNRECLEQTMTPEERNTMLNTLQLKLGDLSTINKPIFNTEIPVEWAMTEQLTTSRERGVTW